MIVYWSFTSNLFLKLDKTYKSRIYITTFPLKYFQFFAFLNYLDTFTIVWTFIQCIVGVTQHINGFQEIWILIFDVPWYRNGIPTILFLILKTSQQIYFILGMPWEQTGLIGCVIVSGVGLIVKTFYIKFQIHKKIFTHFKKFLHGIHLWVKDGLLK